MNAANELIVENNVLPKYFVKKWQNWPLDRSVILNR
jgi:hypothetical protein